MVSTNTLVNMIYTCINDFNFTSPYSTITIKWTCIVIPSVGYGNNTEEKYGDQSNGYLFHNITFFAILYVNRVDSQHQLLAVRKRMTSSAVCSLPVMAKISAAKRLASCS